MAEDWTSDEDRVPDGGWGWVVVFGASLILVLVDIMGQCFGIVFSSFLLDLHTSSAMTAWIFNMFGFLWCMTGPPLGPMLKEFGWRNVTMVSAVMLSASAITSAFATSAWQLFFTYSALGGVACGLLSNVSYMIVPQYFRRRRGLACGIIMMWDCGGQLLGSPLITWLHALYTYRGATLILAGIVLNCCVGAAVFHPIHWHLKPRMTCPSLTPPSPNPAPSTPTSPKLTSGTTQPICTPTSPKPTSGTTQPHCTDNSPEPTSDTTEPRCIPTSGMTQQSYNALSEPSIVAPPNQAKHEGLWYRLVKSTMRDLGILRCRQAVIIAASATVIFNGYLNFLAFVPFALQEAGHSLAQAASTVSVSAGANMLTRLVVATLSDTSIFNFRFFYMMGSLTITASMAAFTVVSDERAVMAVMAVWGCGVGTFMSLFNLVMVRYMGMQRFGPMLGATMLFIAIGYLTIGPLAGYIRDATGSYIITIRMLAATVFISFILWLFMPAPEPHDTRAPETHDTRAPETHDTRAPETHDTRAPETHDTRVILELREDVN